MEREYKKSPLLLFRRFKESNFFSKGSFATIGNFDGIHRGHQYILKELIDKANKASLPSVLISFEPMPEEFLKKEAAPARLSSLREKINKLKRYFPDLSALVILPFNEVLSNLKPQDFIHEILLKKLNIKFLLAGEDFKFGLNRQGDIHLLKKYPDFFSFESISPIKIDNKRVSSTLIREKLLIGDMEVSQFYLGHAFTMIGRVIHGHKRGRSIGFPTLNIKISRNKSPILGVYAVKIHRINAEIFLGVANLGYRPTLANFDLKPLLEVHVFDYDGDLYGKIVEIEFIKKIRDEKKFASFDELKNQIQEDATIAKLCLKET